MAFELCEVVVSTSSTIYCVLCIRLENLMGQNKHFFHALKVLLQSSIDTKVVYPRSMRKFSDEEIDTILR